jgi:hypothetical protein
MSHLIEEYAKNLGVKISKPVVSKQFWPVIPEKYIVIHLESDIDSKKYKYYDIVIDAIKPYLKKLNIQTVQIGSSRSPRLETVDEIIFDLDFKKFAYIISKSCLYVGIDGCFSHYASSIDIPIVNIFGNIYAPINKGYWSDANSINIEAPWKIKPCFSSSDPEDTVNKIPPEQIAQAILDQLGCSAQLSLTTNFIGDFYHQKVFELIPDFFQPSAEMQNAHWFLRLDYVDDAKYVDAWCSFLKSFSFFSKQLIQPDFIHKYRGKLEKINFIIDHSSPISDDYLNFLRKAGVASTLLVKEESDLPTFRNKFFDHNVQLYPKINIETLKQNKINFEASFFSSSKTLISNGKKYPSFYHWQKGQNIVDKNFKIEDNDLLLQEANHFYIYDTSKKL